MKIIENRPERLVLGGVPNLGFALLGGLVVGPALMGGVAFFLYQTLKKPGTSVWSWDTLPLLGCGVFVLFLWSMALVQFLQRERLVLDRVLNTGEHSHRWLFGGRGKTTSFSLDRVHGVSIEHYKSSGGGSRRSMPRDQKRARLLLTKPRRAILLESSEGGIDKRVEPVAREVSEWLKKEIVVMGSPDD